MTSSATVNERVDSKWNHSSSVQVASGRQVSAIHSGLFEQILAAQPAPTIPEPNDSPELDSEPAPAESVEASEDSSSADERPAETQTAEPEGESNEASVDANLVSQIIETQPTELELEESGDALGELELELSKDESSELAKADADELELPNSSTTDEVVLEGEPQLPSEEVSVEPETAAADDDQQLRQKIEQEQAPLQRATNEETSKKVQETVEVETPQEAVAVEQASDNSDENHRERQTETPAFDSIESASRDEGANDEERRGRGDKSLKWYQPKDSDVLPASSGQASDTTAASQSSTPQAAENQQASELAESPAGLARTDTNAAAAAATSSVPATARTTTHSDSSTASSGSKASTEQAGPAASAKRPPGGAEGRTQESSAQRPAKSQDVEKLDQQQQIRLIQRIARSFNRLTADGGVVNLKLHPPQLGSLNVQVRLEGRDMAAKLTTETVAAKEAIIENLSVLRNRLSEQGFEVSTFQVDVGGGQADSNGQGRTNQWTFAHGEQSGFGQQFSGNGQGRHPLAHQPESTLQEAVPQSIIDLFSDQSIDVHA